MDLTDGQWGFLGALSGGLIAVFIASAKSYWSAAASDLEHFRHQYVTALDYFDGGTQRRNIGISILTSLWDHTLAKRHADIYRKSCALLFCNQCLYIFSDGKNRFDGHEQDNLRRMMRTLLSFAEFKESNGYVAQKRDILQAIAHYRDEATAGKKNLGVLEDALSIWEEEIKTSLPD